MQSHLGYLNFHAQDTVQTFQSGDKTMVGYFSSHSLSEFQQSKLTDMKKLLKYCLVLKLHVTLQLFPRSAVSEIKQTDQYGSKVFVCF